MRSAYSAPSAGSSSRMLKTSRSKESGSTDAATWRLRSERRSALRCEICAVGEEPAIPKVVDVHLQSARDVDAPAIPLFARRQPRESALRPSARRARANRIRRAAVRSPRRFETPMQALRASSRPRNASAPCVAYETVGILSGGKQHDPHRGSGVLDLLRRHVDRFGCSRASGRVAVEAQEDVVGVLSQLGRLLCRERRAERRDGILEAGLMQRDAIEVAFDDDQSCDRSARHAARG